MDHDLNVSLVLKANTLSLACICPSVCHCGKNADDYFGMNLSYLKQLVLGCWASLLIIKTFCL